MDIVNKWLTLAANLGVIAGLLLLVYELQQYQDQMDAQISYNLFTTRNENITNIATNEYMSGVISKYIAGDVLTREEQFSLNSTVRGMVFSAEYAWQQFQKGRYTDYDINDTVNIIKTNFWGTNDQWQDMKGTILDSDFVLAIEKELEQ